ncbi:Hypothetical predicted protein [Mytilus galloprovincialis]|uniref:Uncharacterized protein n=1 Tax=Mytilus galloprovincialis TaxID=29158 RepID=A0A8B6G3D3_MYTGA|nr:Hypothetical predicted protein [Mytilus galloprovincialis]
MTEKQVKINNRNLILLSENRKRTQEEKKNDNEHIDKRQRTTQNGQEDKGTNTSLFSNKQKEMTNTSLFSNKQKEELSDMRHIETILNTKIEDMAAKTEYENHVQENRRKQLRKDRQLRNMIHDRLLN